jgi:transcriptional regulator with PAS, ATPase and Fis domain
MQALNWYEEMGFAITVSDQNGIILYMNQKACANNEAEGGNNLVGKNLFDCHPARSLDKVRELYEKQLTNVYTIEKKGIKKLIYQAPWYENGEFSGVVELSIPIPFEMPHYIRK